MATSTTTKKTAAKATPAEAPAAEETLQQKKNRLRNQAERQVIANHVDEYHSLAEELFKAEGLEFTRRLTDEEKAAKKIEELLNQHPELRGKFGKDDPAHVEAANAQEAAVVEHVEEDYIPEQDGPMYAEHYEPEHDPAA
jgi:glutamyl-tRNA reductase